jgi:superoxide dismutase, Cu-Zn family
MRSLRLGLLAGIALAGGASAQELTVTLNAITAQGIGAPLGTVSVASTDGGATLTGELEGLPGGEHGFHLHENGDCGPGPNDQGEVVAGGAAGKHWDPATTGAHQGPEGDGHLGDLPAFVATPDGSANLAATAPRITDVMQLRGKALMIHVGGDNYRDEPKPDGGGGERIACGVIG